MEWNFAASPNAWKFRQDRSFVCIAIGCVGSGKTAPGLQRILDIGMEQEASPDGVRRSRFAVVRNTMPELRSTTAVTYQQIYPQATFGDIIWRSPATHIIAPRALDVEIEVNLIALDKPKDVKKLLSMELTGAFLNEIREIPQAVPNRMTERVGRYGINERPNTWSGLWGDTNPPDADHWLYKLDKETRPAGWEFIHQPPGVLECRPFPGGVEIIDENFPEWAGLKLSSASVLVFYRGKVQMADCELVPIEACERHWIVNPWMENNVALSRVGAGRNPLGPRSYYGRALAGKSLAEIQSYLQGLYVFVQDGRRVVPAYNDQYQAVKNLPILPDADIYLGMDIGGGTLQPAAIIGQQHPAGTYLVQGEVVMSEMGADRFGEAVTAYLLKYFPKHVQEHRIKTCYGDPAGEGRDEIFEVKVFDYLRRTHNFDMRPAPTQDPKMRASAINGPCGRSINGRPGLLLSSDRCPKLRKALSGGWYYKRVQVTGEDRYQDKPVKNDSSHPGDACGYWLLGMGEYERLGGGNKTRGKTRVPGMNWGI